jgi:hypothetical protein
MGDEMMTSFRFVFGSCDFVDRSSCPQQQIRSTNSHESKTKGKPEKVVPIDCSS